MTPSQGAELAILIVCVALFAGYHFFVFCTDIEFHGTIKVMRTARNARRVWARSIAADDKETVTGVHGHAHAAQSFVQSRRRVKPATTYA